MVALSFLVQNATSSIRILAAQGGVEVRQGFVEQERPWAAARFAPPDGDAAGAGPPEQVLGPAFSR